MRTLSAPTLAALAGTGVVLVQLIRLEFSTGTILLNSSNWDLVWDSETYKGAFGLGSISVIEDSPGEIKGISLQLAGVSSDYIALALDDAGVVQGTPLEIRTALLDASTYQVVDAPLEWTGRLDTMTIEETGETCVITATAESSAVDLLRGNALTYTNADQQFLVPGDRAFDQVMAQANTPVIWPSRLWYQARGPR